MLAAEDHQPATAGDELGQSPGVGVIDSLHVGQYDQVDVAEVGQARPGGQVDRAGVEGAVFERLAGRREPQCGLEEEGFRGRVRCSGSPSTSNTRNRGSGQEGNLSAVVAGQIILDFGHHIALPQAGREAAHLELDRGACPGFQATDQRPQLLLAVATAEVEDHGDLFHRELACIEQRSGDRQPRPGPGRDRGRLRSHCGHDAGDSFRPSRTIGLAGAAAVTATFSGYGSPRSTRCTTLSAGRGSTSVRSMPERCRSVSR